MNYNNALSNLSDGSKVEKSEICLVFPSISIIAVSEPRVWLYISTCRTCHVLEMTSRVVRTRDADVPSISALIIHYNMKLIEFWRQNKLKNVSLSLTCCREWLLSPSGSSPASCSSSAPSWPTPSSSARILSNTSGWSNICLSIFISSSSISHQIWTQRPKIPEAEKENQPTEELRSRGRGAVLQGGGCGPHPPLPHQLPHLQLCLLVLLPLLLRVFPARVHYQLSQYKHVFCCTYHFLLSPSQ